ncbi:peptidoglycan recognition protein family protein [Streptomyces flavofungini]|uniref:peptidoglycan recognition protein family protein n=1 Tax=Streptomyces flavofungini TaxID=68200 RepID=UPI0034E021FE
MAAPLPAETLLAKLRAEGVRVAEKAGWRTHTRNHKGPWGPVNGIVIHHTAGANSLGVCWTGTSSLPGPLCHTHLAKNGTATMISGGRANHAGTFAANAHQAVVNESSTHPRPDSSEPVDGNAHYYGIEIENLGNGRDPYPAVQYDQAVRWAAAICRAHGWSADSVIGHKEGTRRKIDPSFDMGRFREDVDERLAHPASWSPGSTTPDEGLGMDAKQVHDAVWGRDAIPSPTSAATHQTNPTWKAASFLPEIIDRLAALTSKVDALTKKIDEREARTP